MDSERTCRRCGDQVGYLSTDDLCDGCVAEQEAEAEALLDADGRRERLEQVAADLQDGKIQLVDHATATARIRQSIAEGEQAMADEVPLTTIEDAEDAATISEWTARDAAGQLGRRLSVNVALDVAAAIEELAARHGIPIPEVVRRAISAYKHLDDERSLGRKVLMERNGTVWEVTFQ